MIFGILSGVLLIFSAIYLLFKKDSIAQSDYEYHQKEHNEYEKYLIDASQIKKIFIFLIFQLGSYHAYKIKDIQAAKRGVIAGAIVLIVGGIYVILWSLEIIH